MNAVMKRWPGYSEGRKGEVGGKRSPLPRFTVPSQKSRSIEKWAGEWIRDSVNGMKSMCYIAAMADYLLGLNDRQREAAMHTEGPLLIIAGAGAGKTKTITHRIARLMADGMHPRQILALTFTNKAADEMRDRVRLLLRESGMQGGGVPLIATFH